MEVQSPIKATPQGVTLTLSIVPRAGRDEVAGIVGDAIKIRLKAPPVEGRANEALLAFLAKLLRVPRANVSIVSGASGRHKVVSVAGLSAEEASRRLALTQN